MNLRVSAPGKMMIAGEYAVLEGAEAIVAAVDRRAFVELREGPRADSDKPEVQAAREAAERRLGAIEGALELDVSALRSGDRKLGLGSSSAAAAAAAGAVYAAHGLDTEEPTVRAQLLEDAFEGHRSIAPEGSGADVAAAVLGGFVRFRRIGLDVITDSLSWPEEARLCVVWTGHPVRTSDMVAKVRELATRDPVRHDALIQGLGEAATGLIGALEDRNLQGIIHGFEHHLIAMADLGATAGVPIVDPITEQIQELARSHRGAAKPSGAGGGDVVLAVFQDSQDEAGFRSGCAEAGFELLSIVVGDVGERVER